MVPGWSTGHLQANTTQPSAFWEALRGLRDFQWGAQEKSLSTSYNGLSENFLEPLNQELTA